MRVREKVIGFEKRRIFGQELLSTHPLEMPEQVFETIGIWIEIEEWIKTTIDHLEFHFMGGIHALEHAIIAIFPLIALCEREDVGGISFIYHHQVGKPAIFIYDGYPGGVGLAEKAFDFIEELLNSVMSLIEECPCEKGCPSCIHSPRWGSGNKPLDKEGSLHIIKVLLGKIPLEGKGKEEVEVRVGLKASEPLSREGGGPTFFNRKEKRIRFFDIETQRSAEEVGGWVNKHLMRLAVAVVYDEQEEALLVFEESEVHELLDLLKASELVVGFNVKRFDYEVLRGYIDFDFLKIPTFDIMEDIFNTLGFRLSLGHLAEMTLGIQKTADGLQAIDWFKSGQIKKLVDYCKQDVLITRALFKFGCENSFLIYQTKRDQKVRVPVKWNLDNIL